MNPLPLAGPSVEPVTLDHMRTYLRLDGTEEDDLVAALIVAGRVCVERLAGIALIEQSWRYALAKWPAGRAIRLPLHPVLRIAALRVFADGGPIILPVADDHIEMRGDVAWLVVPEAVPEPRAPAGRIEIDIVCGFGPAASDVPAPLILAVQRLATHWFEHRGEEGAASVPPDVAALIAPFRRPRLA